jgi:hypothetical protein
MTTLYSFGADARAYRNWALSASTADGVSWNQLARPSNPGSVIHDVATDQTVWLAVGSGWASRSLDPQQSWNQYALQNGWLSLHRIIHAGSRFLAVGVTKNSITLEEHAVIVSTENGVDSSVWPLVYQHPVSSSVFWDITPVGSGFLVVGSENNQSLAVSSADGVIWEQITLDINSNSFLSSVTHDSVSNQTLIGGVGITALGSLSSNSWTTNTHVSKDQFPKAIVSVNVRDDHWLATGGSTAWISNNGVDWKPLSVPGYSLGRTTWFGNRWLIGAHSILTQHTGFELDPVNPQLKGFNNQVHSKSWIQV